MIRHLFRLAWNRKRSNALIILEIIASFLVVFAVATTAVYLAGRWGRPLGFEWRDVWVVRLDPGRGEDEAVIADDVAVFARLLDEVRRMEGVTAAAGSSMPPYGGSTMRIGWSDDHPGLSPQCDSVTDTFREVLGLEVVRGRWFEKADAALSWIPIVIDENLARALYGDKDALGNTVRIFGKGHPDGRIVGVVREFRKGGESGAAETFFFARAGKEGLGHEVSRNLLLKMQPGRGARDEQAIVERLHALAPRWTFEIRRMEEMRADSLKKTLGPLAAGAIIGVFLMLMVALGLLGVLWQNVTRRTGEIGLRRAMGASESDVARQFLAEVAVVTTLGLGVGVVLAAQVPLLGILGFVETWVFVTGIVASAALIYLLTLVCGVYPGILAARTRPAEALHQE